MSVVTPDLTIKATNDLSLMKPVRVTLSLIIDLTMLNKDAINRLLTNEDMLLIFIGEWLNAYDNFKTEFSRTFSSMDDIYKIFIYIIDYLRNRSLNDLLGKILTLLQTNPYLYDGLINILYDKFPDLYNYLSFHTNAIANNTAYNDYTRHEITGVMKTVMSTHVLAVRQDPAK
jgi:hypothetical protein